MNERKLPSDSQKKKEEFRYSQYSFSTGSSPIPKLNN